MTGFTGINLAKLPAPEIIKTVEYEVLLAQMKTRIIANMPELEAYLELESEPAVKVLQAAAYFRMLDRLEFNDGARANMLALSTGTNLDGLGAYWSVERLIVQEADDTLDPLVEEILESDEAFRRRIQLSLEGHSTAGPRGAYIFWALSADGDVKDASVDAPRFAAYELAPAIAAQLPDDVITLQVTHDAGLTDPQPGDVALTTLSNTGDGEVSTEVLSAVEAHVNDDDVRPLTDHLRPRGADILTYEIEATLTLYDGPDASEVIAAANTAVNDFKIDHHRLGHDIRLSGIYAALHQPGVQNVELTSPLADIIVGDHQAAYCTGVDVSFGGRDV